MTAVPTSALAAQASNRFGLGARPDSQLPADVFGWLNSQITGPDVTPSAGLSTVSSGLASLSTLRHNGGASAAGKAAMSQIWAAFQADVGFNLANAVTTATPFRERLVWFWANHFAIMAGTIPVACVAGPFLRDVVRQHVNGTFSQMLQAAILHPAMILSLNADQSVGPQSPSGIFAIKQGHPAGINENLGRETLELYTLGVSAGYTQADVDALAFLLTGADVYLGLSAARGYFYNQAKAQPGNQTLLGVTYPGSASGLAGALNALGTSRETYLHLAAKLVTHFVSDTPSPADIQAVYQALAQSGGSLPAAHNALLRLQNAWVPLQKLKTPREFVVSALRAVNTPASSVPPNLAQALAAMGEPMWQPPFPNGWSDLAADWVGPEPMLLRTDWASDLGLASSADSFGPALATIIPFCSRNTQDLLTEQTSSQEKLSLFFCSPEFQRR